MKTRIASARGFLSTLGIATAIAGCSARDFPGEAPPVAVDEPTHELRPIITDLTDPEETPKRYVAEVRDGEVTTSITDAPPISYVVDEAVGQGPVAEFSPSLRRSTSFSKTSSRAPSATGRRIASCR